MEPLGIDHPENKRLLLEIAGLHLLFASAAHMARFATLAVVLPAGSIARTELPPLPSSFYCAVAGQNVRDARP